MVDTIQEHSIGNATSKIKEGVQDFASAVKETTTNTVQGYADQSTEIIRESPYKSMLIAFGVGALVGALFFRGNR